MRGLFGAEGGSNSREAGLKAQGLTESAEKQVMKSPLSPGRGCGEPREKIEGFWGESLPEASIPGKVKKMTRNRGRLS